MSELHQIMLNTALYRTLRAKQEALNIANSRSRYVRNNKDSDDVTFGKLRIKLLEEKIEEIMAANERFAVKNKELDEANQRFAVKNKELDEANQRFAVKNKELDEANQRFAVKNKELDEANKMFAEVNKQLEEKLEKANKALEETKEIVNGWSAALSAWRALAQTLRDEIKACPNNEAHKFGKDDSASNELFANIEDTERVKKGLKPKHS